MPSRQTHLPPPPNSASDSLAVPSSSTRPINMPPPSVKEPLSRRRPAAPRTTTMDHALNLAAPEIPVVGRYHPLNFYSTSGSRGSMDHSPHSSVPVTPNSSHTQTGSMTNGSQPSLPRSPRSHTRTLSEVERRLHGYYRERALVSASRSMFSPAPPAEDEPHGPRLVPAASPGIVTPLELETNESYFTAKGGILAASANRSSTPSPTTASRGQRSGESSPRACGVFAFDKGSLSPGTPGAIGSF